MILAFAAVALYLRGRAGRELNALRDDELAAATVGVHNTFRKLQAFTVSAILGAIAGALLAANSTVIDPSLFQPLISFQIFLMIVIGGLGSLGGAVAGAAIVVWLVQLTPGTRDSAYVALGVLVILLMAVFPQGLAGVCLWLMDTLRFGRPHIGGSGRGGSGTTHRDDDLGPDAALGAGTGAKA